MKIVKMTKAEREAFDNPPPDHEIEELEAIEHATGLLAARAKDARKVLGGPPDTCGGERARRISIAITHLETAELWLREAGYL